MQVSERVEDKHRSGCQPPLELFLTGSMLTNIRSTTLLSIATRTCKSQSPPETTTGGGCRHRP